MDWSPPLLLATHDDDEQNARLSLHVWEDNGLDVPEQYLDDLVPFLGITHYLQAVPLLNNQQITRTRT
jgi:hypothetical protein